MSSSNALHEPGSTHRLLIRQVGELRHVDTGRPCREGREGVTLSHFCDDGLVIWISLSRKTYITELQDELVVAGAWVIGSSVNKVRLASQKNEAITHAHSDDAALAKILALEKV